MRPGDNVAIRVPLGVEDICKGFVVASPAAPPPAVTQFICYLYLADLTETRPIFTAGYDCIFHCHTIVVGVVY